MISEDLKQIKEVVKEGTLEVLESHSGQMAIVGALKTSEGRQAIVDALKTKEAKEVITGYFTESFQDVVMPTLEDHDKKITELREKVRVLAA